MGLSGAFEVAKAWVTVGADTSKLGTDLDKSKQQISSKIASIQSKVGSILAGIGLGIGVSKLLSGAREAIGLAEIQANAQIRLAAVVKATGGAAGFTAIELQDMASNLQKVTTVGDEEILGLQSILLTFKNIKGDVFEATAEAALDMAVVLGTDAKSGAIQLGKAMNDPIKGVTALSRVGIQFTDQQREQIKIMQESGDIFGAQAIILREMQGQFGGLARAMAEGPIGKTLQLQNAMGDLREEIGNRLIPAKLFLTKVMFSVTDLMNQIGSAISVLIPSFDGVSQGAINFGVAFGGIVTAGLAVLFIVPKIVIAFVAIKRAALALQASLGPVGIATALTGLAASAAIAAAVTVQSQDEIAAAIANSESALSSSEDRMKRIDLLKGGGTGGAGGGVSGSASGSALGFRGIEDIGRTIQENLLTQQAEQRSERMLDLSEQNNSIQEKILNGIGEVKGAVERQQIGVVKSRGTV